MNTAGSVILVNFDGTELDCQLDSSFEASVNLTANNPCKGESKAETQTVSSTSWQISLNGKTQTGSATDHAQSALLDALKAGLPVEVTFAPKASLIPDSTNNWVITGNVFVSQLTIDAPVDGESTYSGTLTGTGDWVKTNVPVV